MTSNSPAPGSPGYGLPNWMNYFAGDFNKGMLRDQDYEGRLAAGREPPMPRVINQDHISVIPNSTAKEFMRNLHILDSMLVQVNHRNEVLMQQLAREKQYLEEVREHDDLADVPLASLTGAAGLSSLNPPQKPHDFQGEITFLTLPSVTMATRTSIKEMMQEHSNDSKFTESAQAQAETIQAMLSADGPNKQKIAECHKRITTLEAQKQQVQRAVTGYLTKMRNSKYSNSLASALHAETEKLNSIENELAAMRHAIILLEDMPDSISATESYFVSPEELDEISDTYALRHQQATEDLEALQSKRSAVEGDVADEYAQTYVDKKEALKRERKKQKKEEERAAKELREEEFNRKLERKRTESETKAEMKAAKDEAKMEMKRAKQEAAIERKRGLSEAHIARKDAKQQRKVERIESGKSSLGAVIDTIMRRDNEED